MVRTRWREAHQDLSRITPLGDAAHRLSGRAWENGYNERFNGTLRREVLNAEWFTTTRHAQIVIALWLKQYNHTRPHQALSMRPPAPETLIRNGPAIAG